MLYSTQVFVFLFSKTIIVALDQYPYILSYMLKTVREMTLIQVAVRFPLRARPALRSAQVMRVKCVCPAGM